MINELYAEDFEHYGYDLDPKSNFIPDPVYQEQIISSELVSIAQWRGQLEVAALEFLVAEQLSRSDYGVAGALLRRAVMLDTGNFDIFTKLIELEEFLGLDTAVWERAESAADQLLRVALGH